MGKLKEKEKKKTSYRRAVFKKDNSGAYVMLYQRPGERPRLDMNFFEGDRPLGETRLRLKLLARAVEKADVWDRETR